MPQTRSGCWLCLNERSTPHGASERKLQLRSSESSTEGARRFSFSPCTSVGEMRAPKVREGFHSRLVHRLKRCEHRRCAKVFILAHRTYLHSMDKILLMSLGSRGDMEPFLALGEELQQAGHQIAFCMPAQFQLLAQQVSRISIP